MTEEPKRQRFLGDGRKSDRWLSPSQPYTGDGRTRRKDIADKPKLDKKLKGK